MRVDMRRQSARQFVIHAALLFSTTVLPLAVGKLVIPLEWYTFRTWEMVIDQRRPSVARGPFYPRQHVRRTEVGDLGVRTRFAVEKKVEWYTDEFGYRNRPSRRQVPYDIVIVGGSEAAGSSLTQRDTLAEVLAARTGLRVYAYAPAGLGQFLDEERFRQSPPALVIFSHLERQLYRLPLHALTSQRPEEHGAPGGVMDHRSSGVLPEWWTLGMDRLRKKPLMTRHLYNHLIRKSFINAIVNETHRMLFFPPSIRAGARYRMNPEPTVRTIAATLTQYAQEVTARGMRFLALLVPDKEHIYWGRVPPQHVDAMEPPDFLARLVAQLDGDGDVDVIDLAAVYEREQRQDTLLYHLDDTHWNATGVSVAVEALVAKLERIGFLKR